MATAQDIQNSEKLLDLSNQLIDSINERKKTLKEINAVEQLYLSSIKLQQKLSQDITATAEKYLGYQIKSKELDKQIEAAKKQQKKSEDTFNAIEKKIIEARKKSTIEARNINTSIIKQKQELFASEQRRADLETRKQIAISKGDTRSAQYLQNRIKDEAITARFKLSEIDSLQKQLDKEVKIRDSAKETIKNEEKAKKTRIEEIAFLEKNLETRKRIEKSTGLLGAVSKSLAKVPGIGQYLNADEAITEMEKLAAEIENSEKKATSFSNRLQIGLKGASVLAKGFYENIKSPEAIFTFFIKAALTANSEVVKLGKSLGSSSEEYRENLVKAERSSNSVNVTTKNLVAAFDELVTATGYVGKFSADTLKTQIMLTKEFGLTGDEAAGVYKFSALTGKASSTINKEMVGAFAATRNSLKAGIPFKAAIAEAAKVSGALSSNFQNDPKRIAAAVVQAKALGTSLEQTAKQGEALLNFESSIENELKAELLTGRQLNLERARAAALAGDQVTLTEELVKNVGSIEEFDRMNVLQKKALAEAVGLSTDELAKQLQNQKIAQETGKSIAQVTQDQLLEEQKRQDVQSKFNAAIEKLQSLIGNLVAGPLGSFFNLLSGALNIVNEIGKALSFLAIPLKIVGGLFLAIKTSQLAIHGYQLAINSSKAVEQGLLARQMILEEGKFNLSKLNYLLQGESYRVKLAAYAVSLREIIAERAKNIATSIGNLLGKKGLLSSIGSAVMGAISAIFKGPTAFLGPFAIPIALAAGATVGAIGAKFLFAKGGIVTGEINNATVGEAGPEAIIPLNSPKADKILGNNEIPSIDLTPMISAINEVRAAVNNLMNRPVVVNMDGKQIGSSLVQSSYKMA